MASKQDLAGLEQRFRTDLDRLVKELVDAFGLAHSEDEAHLADPLLRWLDFVARYVPPRPRHVVRSSHFPAVLDPTAGAGLAHLLLLMASGGDLNPYQSKGLIAHNDVSSRKRRQRTDLLWADWGIHHFHLNATAIAPGHYFSPRADWLLFCLVEHDRVGLIDVRSHAEASVFSSHELIATVAESWPAFMERFRLPGIVAGENPRSPAEREMLRKGGVSSLVVLGDHVYQGPGLGITSASTSARVSRLATRVRHGVRQLAALVDDPASQFSQEARAAGVDDPDYGLALTPRGLCVYETHQDKAFVLPRQTASAPGSDLGGLHDLVVPNWAMVFITGRR